MISKTILRLVLLNVLILLAGYFFVPAVNLNIPIADIAILTGGFSVIAITTVLIFIKGQTKEPDGQTLYTLVAISLKFLLELVFALLWFFNAKKNSFENVLIFFVLYLALSLFSIWMILKTLKDKAL